MFSATEWLCVCYIVGNWASNLCKDTNFGVINVLHLELLSFSRSSINSYLITCFISPFETQQILFVFGLSLIFFLPQTLTLDFDEQRSVPELTEPPPPATHTPVYPPLHASQGNNDKSGGGGVFAND